MKQVSGTPLSQRLLPEGPLRQYVRRGALKGMSVGGDVSGSTRRALERPRVQFFYLHFLPSDKVEYFEQFLDFLEQQYEVVPYGRAVELASSVDVVSPIAALSFDDGFLSNIEAGKILERRGISACFFVCTDLVGKDRRQLLRTFPDSLGEEVGSMSWADIEGLLLRGHEIGSHTRKHPILSQCGEAEVEEEIVGSRVDLISRIGQVDHFAWPCGQWHHFRRDMVDVVYSAGYRSLASAVRGAHVPTASRRPICLRREHVDLNWPLADVRYLAARSARRADATAGEYPGDDATPSRRS